MNIIQAIILGIVQGLTEFIPISSSGHLVLFRDLFGFKDQGLTFDVFLHLATLLAVIIYFRKDIIDIIKNIKNTSGLFWQIIIATIPAVVIGFLFNDLIEGFFRHASWTALFMIITGLYFILAEKKAKQLKQTKDIKWLDSLWIGISQAIAILPGVSRSGATIATGMFRNLKRTSAAKFSFLLSIVAILGAATLSAKNIIFDGKVINSSPAEIILGSLFAFISGLLAIKFLMNFFKKHGLIPFAIYVICIGSIILIYSLIK